MKSKKFLKPGQPGTKKWVSKYGDDLFCVRYRYDDKKWERITTVEIIVDRSEWGPKFKKIPKNKLVGISVGIDEINVRRLVKKAGGRWNRNKRVWELPYGEILSLGLSKRIVEE